jgi:lipopolysaccharide/colanic/teichoic acid biosynthesis glycosyltransferase
MHEDTGAALVVLELLFLLLVIALLRSLLVPGSGSVTSVVAAWVILAGASYLVGEFETTARANFGLTVRTQAAFGMAYAGYGILHALWPWCETLTIRFWLALWLYLSLAAPFIGLLLRFAIRQRVLLVADPHQRRLGLLRWWGFECCESILLEELEQWLAASSDDRGHVTAYNLVVVDTSDPRTEHVVAGLSDRYFLDFIGIPSFRMVSYLFGPHPRLIASYSLNGVARRMKRVVDLVVSGVALVLLWPFLLLVALVIKLDSSGPVFYRHRRLGRNMRPFNLLKFRTMHRDAAERLRELLASDPNLAREYQATFKLKCDPRVTRVGGFLRKFSIDELPQFFNILVGEMSFVGPRPIVDEEVKYYRDFSLLLFRVRPGATGLWQVSGRSDTSYESRVRLDTRYVQEWTFWDDLRIIFRTLPAVLARRGAY